MINDNPSVGLTNKDQIAIKKSEARNRGYQVASLATVGLLLTTAIPFVLNNRSEPIFRQPADRSQIRNASWMGDAVLVKTTTAEVASDFYLRINLLKEKTGLTWSQIAKLFDVSTRAVHHWAVGGKMNSFNIETLNFLEANLFLNVTPLSSDERKSKIFSINELGKSIFDIAMERKLMRHPDLNANPLSATEQIALLQG